MKELVCKYLLLIYTIFYLTIPLQAQSPTDFSQTTQTILSIDDTFWIAFNACEVETMRLYLDDSLEFYHDKGGLTKSADQLIGMSKAERCNGSWPMVLRRELVEGSRKVYPLPNYGAILYGEHLFYGAENGGEEKLLESGKYMHIWQLKDGKWRMTRVVSYDHQNLSNN